MTPFCGNQSRSEEGFALQKMIPFPKLVDLAVANWFMDSLTRFSGDP